MEFPEKKVSKCKIAFLYNQALRYPSTYRDFFKNIFKALARTSDKRPHCDSSFSLYLKWRAFRQKLLWYLQFNIFYNTIGLFDLGFTFDEKLTNQALDHKLFFKLYKFETIPLMYQIIKKHWLHYFSWSQ